jgi:hypothetical protein
LGLVLARSFWLAQVSLLEWRPQHEITHRRLAPLEEVLATLPEPLPIWRRIFREASLAAQNTKP